jgi:hypothetical protein
MKIKNPLDFVISNVENIHMLVCAKYAVYGAIYV